MDVRYINPFIEAIHFTVQKMIRTKVQVKRPTLRTNAKRLSDRHTIAIQIDLSGGTTGMVVLRIPKLVACELVRSFSAGITRQLDAEGLDALGEIANIIVGNAKRLLPGALSTISTPKILETESIPFSSKDAILVVPISSTLGMFWLEAQLRPGEVIPSEEYESVQESHHLDPTATEAMVQQLIAAASQ